MLHILELLYMLDFDEHGFVNLNLPSFYIFYELKVK